MKAIEKKGWFPYYAKNNIDITANDIIITTGGSEAILFGFMACLDAGDEVIIPEPFMPITTDSPSWRM